MKKQILDMSGFKRAVEVQTVLALRAWGGYQRDNTSKKVDGLTFFCGIVPVGFNQMGGAVE